MSQIDKAFLSAYAKKRIVAPSSTAVRPLVDPTGERLLKIHAASSKTDVIQPHISPAPSLPPAIEPTLVPKAMVAATKTIAATHTELPASANINSVHISPTSVRIASSSSIRSVPKNESSPAPVAAARIDANRIDYVRIDAAPHAEARQATTPARPATGPKIQSIEPPPRKTLTSYLQQARQSNTAPEAIAIPLLKTRWSPTAPTAPTTAEPKVTVPGPVPAAEVRTIPSAPEQHFRIDARHANYPPVSRPESTIPWSFGIVERSIKATADSESISARTSNEYHPLPESVVAAAPPPIVLPAARDTKPEQAPSPQIETQRRPSPFGKNLSPDSHAKITLPIQPVWEVDEFLWPSATANLIATQAEAFHEIGLHLQHAQSKGLRVLSVTSGERGVGRSTTAMCLAKTMSKLGMRIALFDGDYECPSLVDQLNIEAQSGWQQCLLENIPLDEVAIHAVEESITLFPLTDSIATSQIAVHALRINKLIKRISNAYDMVIIDANRLTQKQSQLLGTGDEAVLDAALLIVDAELSLRQRVDAAIDMVRQQGVESIGLVENFHS